MLVKRWSEEDVSQLNDLIIQKLTGSQIAAIMGRSRNAVLGKAFRLGLRLCSPQSYRRPTGWQISTRSPAFAKKSGNLSMTLKR